MMKTIIKLLIIITLLISTSYTLFCAEEVKNEIMPREKYLELAKQYAKEHKTEKLNELMADMLEKYPDDPNALNHKSVLLMFNGKFNEAEKTIRSAIEKNSGYNKLDELYMTLGDIYNLKLDYSKAEEYFKKAIELNPHSQAISGLGFLYVRQKRYKDATEQFELYLKNRKGDAQLFLRMGDAYYGLGEYKSAVIAYEKSIEYGGAPHDFYKLMGLAKSYEALGDYYHAKPVYEELYKWQGYNAEVRREYKRFMKKLEEQKKK